MDLLNFVDPALKADWESVVADLIAYDDLPTLWDRIFIALAEHVDISSFSVIAYPLDRGPVVIYASADEDPKARRIEAYIAGAYLLDPFYWACTKTDASGVQLLADIAPAEFEESQYFRTFFSKFGLCDEVNIIQRMPDQVAVALSLGRPTGARKFGAKAILRLAGIAGQIGEICERSYGSFCVTTESPDASQAFHSRLRAAMANFGTSVLTPREKEVLDHLLRGYSVKSAAENLGVSAGTVRIHRHSIYEKLDVGTQTELFALILECLRLTTDDISEDPLKHMMPPDH